MRRGIDRQAMRQFPFVNGLPCTTRIRTSGRNINQESFPPFRCLFPVVIRRVLMVPSAIARYIVDEVSVRQNARQLMRRIGRVRHPHMFIGISIRFLMFRNNVTTMFVRRLITRLRYKTYRRRTPLLLIIISVNFRREGIRIPLHLRCCNKRRHRRRRR